MTLFASPDIAALVAAFPAPSPTKEQHSLVRSRSGESLRDSRTVLTRFRTLLETEPGRIRLSDLPSRLGIESTDWLLPCYQGTIRYSKNRQSIISDAKFANALEELQSRCQKEFVELSSFAIEKDVLLESFTNQTEWAKARDLHLFHSNTTQSFLGSPQLVDNTQESIKLAIRGVHPEKLDLSIQLSRVPRVVLIKLAQRVIDDTESIEGELEEGHDGRVDFVPSSYWTAQEEDRRAQHELNMQKLLHTLEESGFCRLDGISEAEDVCSRYHNESPGIDITTIDLSHTSSTVVLQSLLSQTIEHLKADVATMAPDLPPHTDLRTDSDTKTKLVATASQPTLASVVLESKHVEAVQAALDSAFAELELAQRKEFEEAVQLKIMAPVLLYAAGMDIVADASLKQRLDEYVCEHFRKELIPASILLLHDVGSIKAEKVRTREIEKFENISGQAQTFAAIESAVFKFARKIKCEQPTPDQLIQVKTQILEQRLKAMQKMDRGSDVLQNLTWILLAQCNTGLFLSAGKDTSRMLKQYQLNGDLTAARSLEHWRDALKAGTMSKQDLQEMKDMAVIAVSKA